jgi:hypothetical protein
MPLTTHSDSQFSAVLDHSASARGQCSEHYAESPTRHITCTFARTVTPLFFDKYWLQMLSCLWNLVWIRLIPALADPELGVEICGKARRFWSYVIQAHNLYFLTHVHQSSRATFEQPPMNAQPVWKNTSPNTSSI